MVHGLIDWLIRWYREALDTGGYPLIALLMAIESSVFPLPSELVIPPVAHIAWTSGKFSLVWIVVAGTLGSWVGAAVMYWVSRAAGRPFLLRYGRFFFISPEKVAGAERWAKRFGPYGIFAARLLPVVRHLIGIPAGVVRMDFRLYSLFTVLGSALWCSVLCWLGVKMGQDDRLMKGELHRLTLWLVGLLAVLGALYYFLVHRYMKENGPKSQSPSHP
jgi:membrane protein DedA with SNARE-associated domain